MKFISYYTKPLSFLLTTAICLGVTEIVIMLMIHFFPPFPPTTTTIIDSFALLLVSLPILHLLWLYPVIKLIKKNQATEISLEELSNNLELKVKKRTSALLKTKDELEVEVLQHKDTLRNLERSELTFRSVIESSNDAIIVSDRNSKIIFINENGTRMFGYLKSEMNGMPISQIIPKCYRQGHLNGIERVVSTGISKFPHKTLEFAGLRKDGSLFPVELNVASWQTTSGETYFSGMIRDISERKITEHELQEYEIKLDAIFNNARDGILVVDISSQKFIMANRSICEMLGYTESEFTNLGVKDIHPANDLPMILECFNKQVHGNLEIAMNLPVLKKDGTICQFDISSSTVLIEEKKCIIGLFRDISERLQYEKEKNALRIQQERSQRLESIGTLASGIAHDFNNALTPILGFSQLLSENFEEDSQQQKDVNQIINAGNRAKELILQILSFCRGTKHETFPLQTHLIVKEVLKLARAAIPAEIEIREHIETNNTTILASPDQIHQLVMNLMINAYHAMPKGGILDVSMNIILYNDIDSPVVLSQVDKNSQYLQLVFKDTGCGMSEETMLQIFEPYFTTKAEGQGTGLGLAIVHNVVKHMNGVIDVSSQLEAGTTFSIYIPLIDGKAAACDNKSLKSITSGCGRILVIDDELPVVDLTQRTLEYLGYSAKCFTNPRKALEYVRKNPGEFDVIITDSSMPEISGHQLIKDLRRMAIKAPIILVSGFDSPMDEKDVKKYGVYKSLTKPVSVQEFSIVLDEAIKLKS